MNSTSGEGSATSHAPARAGDAGADGRAPVKVYFVRHGETAWSLSGQHTGRTDIPLTANGEAGARRLSAVLTPIRFAAVLTSPRTRAQHTCELAGLGAGARIEPDLQEWDYGDYEGRRSVDIHVTRPGWNIFNDGCPGGESPEQITARVDRLVALLAGLEGNVALFAHGHLGRVLAARWLGAPVALGEHLILDPASLSILTQDARHPEVRVIERWNTVPGVLS